MNWALEKTDETGTRVKLAQHMGVGLAMLFARRMSMLVTDTSYYVVNEETNRTQFEYLAGERI